MRPSRREDWPRSALPGLDWLRTDDARVVVTLRHKFKGGAGGWVDAKPLTITGCAPLFWLADSPAYLAFSLLSMQPQMFMPGLEPADAITRNLLRADVRRYGDLARASIERACAGFIAWLDQADEDETPTLSRIEAAE